MPRLLSRRSRSSNQLRDQLLKDLQKEGEKILKKLATDFTADINKHLGDALQSALGGSGKSGGGSGGAPFSLDSLGNIFTSAITYLVSRPRTTRSTAESSRSKAMTDSFRLSRSQAAAEAQLAMGKAQRNR